MSVTFKKKLSAKTIVGDVKKMIKDGTLAPGAVLYRAIGIADNMRTGQSAYGEWTAFSGDFEVTNMVTGEVLRGAEFFPDKGFTEALANRLRAAPGESVEFALEVCIDISDDYPTGYAYVTRPILADAHNRLGALRERVAALPAPDAEAPKAKKGGK